MQNGTARDETATILARVALIGLLNMACASSIYWPQAVLGQLKSSLGHPYTVGLSPSLALIGYALGVATLAVAARDLSNRVGLLAHAVVMVGGLVILTLAPTARVALAGSLLMGSGCAMTQRMLIIATTVVRPERRADAIGLLIATGLAGIVVARAVVGEAAAVFGWRELFAAQACTIGATAAVLALISPASTGSSAAQPPAVVTLWRRHAILRRAAVGQAAAFGAYNAAWALLPRFAHTTPSGRAVLAGIGAVTAVVAGRAARRVGPARMARVAAIPIGAAGAVALATREPLALVTAMALVEVGTQLSLVSNQTRAQAAAPDLGTQGRMATVVTAVGFAGGALGAAGANLLAG